MTLTARSLRSSKMKDLQPWLRAHLEHGLAEFLASDLDLHPMMLQRSCEKLHDALVAARPYDALHALERWPALILPHAASAIAQGSVVIPRCPVVDDEGVPLNVTIGYGGETPVAPYDAAIARLERRRDNLDPEVPNTAHISELIDERLGELQRTRALTERLNS